MADPIIDVYTLVHNEIKMLPYFFRHYGSFARRIFVFEDSSTDGSREFLEQQPNVTIIEPAVHGLAEDYWITKLWPLYEKYSRGVADWVIDADVDEFVYHPDLLGVLAQEKELGHHILFCKGYVMIADEFPSGPGQIYEQVKTGLKCGLSRKWSVYNPAIYLRYAHGMHRIREYQPDAVLANPGLKLLHYRQLGVEHILEHDRRIQARLNFFSHVEKPFEPHWRRSLPDWTKGSLLDWYAAHKGQAYNVVD